MEFKVTTYFVTYLLFLSSNFYLTNGQNVRQNTRIEEASVVDGITKFSLNLLKEVNLQAESYNVILSSYSVWLLFAILGVGSRGDTSTQINQALGIPSRNAFYSGLNQIRYELAQRTRDVELDLANALLVDFDTVIRQNFADNVQREFNVSVIKSDFKNPRQTVSYVDRLIEDLSRGKIKHFLNYEDLQNAVMLLTTAIYFKGNWKMPFNRTATFRTAFFDETLTRRLGTVDMMYQQGEFPLAKLSGLPGHVVELPYGDDERYSMLIILPQRNVPLQQFLDQLTPRTMAALFEDLERSKIEFAGEDVIVYLPKFQIASDFVLNIILEKLGIRYIFHPQDADLNPMGDNLYLSRVVHKAIIEVDEEGTVAAAITGGTISYKSPPAVFNASHPFVFMIINTATRTPLFVGKYSNPNQ